MSLLLTLLILVIIFVLIWYLIGLIPFPPMLANVRWVFYALLVIVAIIMLLNYIPGVHLP